MTDLSAAIAAAREALRNSHATANERPHWLALEAAISALLAALDAAQGDAVLEVVGGADGWRGIWQHKPLSEIEVGTMLYLAPQAPPAAVDGAAALAARLDKMLAAHADSMPKEAYFEVDAVMRALKQAPPAAAPARMKVPRTLTPEMREVLTRMLTNCRTVDESYGELLAAAAKGNDNG